MPEETKIISCIPVMNAKNMAHAHALGMQDPVPWIKPYPGSIRGTCMICNGDVWIGPGQQAHLVEHADSPVWCHLCTLAAVTAQPQGWSMTSLTKANTGFIRGHEL